MFKIFIIAIVLSSTLFADYYINQGKKELLTPLDAKEPYSKSRQDKAEPKYYKTRAGQRLGVDKKIIISFSDISIQLYIEREFSLSLLSNLHNQMFLYKVDNQNDTLALANKISKIKGIAFAHPDFIIQKKNRTRDPLYDESWHLHDDSAGINVEEAWEYNRGKGIIVAVYDEGIDIEHEDLRDNIIGFGNYNNKTGQIYMIHSKSELKNYSANAPSSTTDAWHGTSCAGLIAASADNYKGSTGVAPEAKLLAVRYANDNISRDIEAFYSMANHGAAIISNSWGTYSMFDAFNETLRVLSEDGRDGKGVLIFFAAGNGYNGSGCNMDLFYSLDSAGNQRCEKSSKYTAIHDESESPYVISIAASTQYNRIADYSNYGSAIDFTSTGSEYPSSIVTTDAMGAKGAYDQWNYTESFSGTSAAAPIAAGIAALVLSENPELSKEEVLDIFKTTADKEGRYRYIDGRNDHWGYGRINAGRAVALASHYGQIKIKNFAHKIYADMH